MSNLLDNTRRFDIPKTDPYQPQVSREGIACRQDRQTIRECVAASLKDYFSKVDPEHISNLYELVLSEVEAPLLKTVMEQTRSNQSKASVMLGLNRGTLRKKLKQYGMLE